MALASNKHPYIFTLKQVILCNICAITVQLLCNMCAIEAQILHSYITYIAQIILTSYNQIIEKICRKEFFICSYA